MTFGASQKQLYHLINKMDGARCRRTHMKKSNQVTKNINNKLLNYDDITYYIN